MENIEKACNAILAPVRDALKHHTAAAAQVAELDRLEQERDSIKAKVSAAATSTEALSFVDALAKIDAQITIAKLREPIDSAVLGKASQAADQALAQAISEFSGKIVEPLHKRAEVAAGRIAYVFTGDPAGHLTSSGLTGEALSSWWNATNSVYSTAVRVASLEAMIPLLGAAFERVAKLEKAASVVADLDNR